MIEQTHDSECELQPSQFSRDNCDCYERELERKLEAATTKANNLIIELNKLWFSLNATGLRMCECGMRERDDPLRIKEYAHTLRNIIEKQIT